MVGDEFLVHLGLQWELSVWVCAEADQQWMECLCAVHAWSVKIKVIPSSPLVLGSFTQRSLVGSVMS